MTWKPTSRAPLQFQDSNSDNYSGAVLKFYQDGTTNALTVASDGAGVDTFTSVALDASGYPVRSGSPIVVYLQEDYKMVLYPDQTSADANTGAIWTIDNLTSTVDETFDSITAATANVTGHIKVGTQGPGTDGDNVVVLENGTVPTSSPENTVQIFSVDLSAGNTIQGIRTEGSPLSGGTTNVGTYAIKLNGTNQYFLTSQNAGDSQLFVVPREVTNSVSSSANTTTLDLSSGLSFSTTLTENTTIAFSNVPASGLVVVDLEITQDTSARTVTHPTAKWNSGSAHVMSTGSGEIDIVQYRTRDGGTTWYGFVMTQAAA